MRKYSNKKNVQQKSYYNDRFYISPIVPRNSIYDDSIYSNDCLSLQRKININDAYIELDHLVICVNSVSNFKVIEHLRDVLCYDFLVELTAVDYLEEKNKFEIIYEMLSTSKRKRIRVKCLINKDEAIESVNPLFRMADWSEREMFDMYGIKINNHPFLKRILMPDDWSGHPLLKSYPMQGDEAASWYEVDKIFGKDARDTIGKEIRDEAKIDRYDTTRFARLGHEVPYGTDITDGKEPDHTPLAYQEEDGVKLFGARLVTKFDEDKSNELEKRR